ncbi:hypothetical protein CRM22_008309 [Opisthorchis felineus]|uniref:Uncharacterized protein n=1 Tax=Opisthorchis felineus TaxID=147828 RepID=A0A4S2LK34_OPIFE|nr:hypothetical protein CRM22_008309 [Opisthorchis felineus]
MHFACSNCSDPSCPNLLTRIRYYKFSLCVSVLIILKMPLWILLASLFPAGLFALVVVQVSLKKSYGDDLKVFIENYTRIFQERNPCLKMMPEIQANSAFIDITPITCLISLQPGTKSDHKNIYLMINRDQLPTEDTAFGSLDKLAKQVEELLPHKAFSVKGVSLKKSIEEVNRWPREFAGPFPVILDAYQELDTQTFTVVKILASVVNDRMPEMSTQNLTQMELWLFAKHQRLSGLYFVERGGRYMQERHQVIPFYFHFERKTPGPKELLEQTKPVIKDISRATGNSRISVLLSKYEQKCFVTEEPRPVVVWFVTVQLALENQKASVNKLAAGEKEINRQLVELIKQMVNDGIEAIGLSSGLITVTVDYLYTDGIDQLSAAIHIYQNLIEFHRKTLEIGLQELQKRSNQMTSKSSAQSGGILLWEKVESSIRSTDTICLQPSGATVDVVLI